MPKRQPAPPTDPLERALHLLTTTDRPIEEIATEVGCPNRGSLDDRLRRRYGATARALRTGEPTLRGRPATGRREVFWRPKFFEEEWAIVERAILREREAGAETDAEAIVAIVRRAGRPKKRA